LLVAHLSTSSENRIAVVAVVVNPLQSTGRRQGYEWIKKIDNEVAWVTVSSLPASPVTRQPVSTQSALARLTNSLPHPITVGFGGSLL
jgi:hypothetical protein